MANIKAIGNKLSVGHFIGGSNIFGFDEGVILSSGNIKLAEGPNKSVEASATFADNGGDPDVDKLAFDEVYDVAGIEFDFIPIGETVTFRYVFASEEYCEFVGSIFNDVFGFFVSGPGINGPFQNGAVNVALLPGTSQYVAINSVNFEKNAAYYMKNELPEDANRCGIPFGAPFRDLIEYDGFTIPLWATLNVIPCETYHIRLLVSDVGDDKLDSGVFLEAKSFNIGSNLFIRAEAEGSNQPVLIEGCRDGRFVFVRPQGGLDEPLTVDFSISDASTAENGVDFDPIPGAVVIPAGETSAVLPVQLIDDQLAETPETLRVELTFPCECLEPVSAEFILKDPEPMKAAFFETGVCAGQEFTIGPSVVSGADPFTYLWQDGSTGPTITATVTQTTQYTVTVTDACNTSAPVVVAAVLQPVPTAVLSGEAEICDSQDTFLKIEFGGHPPWSVGYTIDGGNNRTISNISQNPFFLRADREGLYELTAFRDANCTGEISGSGRVFPVGVSVEVSLVSPACFNSADGEIFLEIKNGKPPFQVNWDKEVNDNLNPTGLLPGIYSVSITDSRGCFAVEDINLLPEEGQTLDCLDFNLFVPSVFSPNGDGFNDLFHIFPEPDIPLRNVKSLHIFNRWGAVVYKKTNFLPSSATPLWDGHFKGRPMEEGIFVWQLVIELQDGTEKILSGDVLLIR